MKRSQEIALAQSERRQRANELSAKDELTTEERTELQGVLDAMQSGEVQFRAAVQSEDAEAAEQRSSTDGEGAEIGRLQREVRCGAYLTAAVESRAIAGAEAELNAARNLGPDMLPWDALLPDRVEARQDTASTPPASGNPINQSEILSRVFARSASSFLRVAMPSVGVGQASFPVFATGASGGQAAKGTAQDAEATTFTANVLSPKRGQARYLFAVEDLATTRGLEEAYRDDLGMVLSDLMDRQVLTGTGAGAQVAGFLGGHADGLTLPADEASPKTTYTGYRELITGQVDGIYASTRADIRLLINPKTLVESDIVYRGADSYESGIDAMQRISGGVMVSGNMPDEASSNSLAIACRGMQPAAQAPIWSGVRLIRDEVTRARQGQVAITAVMLWAFKITRKAQYAALKVRTTT